MNKTQPCSSLKWLSEKSCDVSCDRVFDRQGLCLALWSARWPCLRETVRVTRRRTACSGSPGLARGAAPPETPPQDSQCYKTAPEYFSKTHLSVSTIPEFWGLHGNSEEPCVNRLMLHTSMRPTFESTHIIKPFHGGTRRCFRHVCQIHKYTWHT